MKKSLALLFVWSLLAPLSAQTITKFDFEGFSPLNYEGTKNTGGGRQLLMPSEADLTAAVPNFSYNVEGTTITSPEVPFDLSNCTTKESFTIVTQTPAGSSATTGIAVRQLKKAPYNKEGYTLPIPAAKDEDPWTTASTGFVHGAMNLATVNQWRFGASTACLVVGFDFAPRQLNYRLWALSNPVPNNDAAAFTVEQSADGKEWTTVVKYATGFETLAAGSASSPIITYDLLQTTRYVKFYYANRTNVNVPLNYLNISAVSQDPPVPSLVSLEVKSRSSVDFSIQSDKDAACYWAVRSSNTPVTTAEQLQQSASFAVKVDELATQRLAVPTDSDLVIDYLLKDHNGKLSAVASSSAFSTAGALQISSLYSTQKQGNDVVVSFTGNDPATLYYQLLPLGSSLPTAAEIVANPTASVPYSPAPDRATFAVSLVDDVRYTVASVLQKGEELSAVTTLTIKREDEADRIRQRYFDFVLGSQSIDYADPYVSMRYEALKTNIVKAHQKVKEFDPNQELAPWDLSGASQTPDISQCRDLLNNALLPLALAYNLKGAATDPNPDYQSEATRLEIVRLYRYLAKRNFLKGCTLEFAGGGVYLGLTGYFYASMLVRDLLIEEGLLSQVTDMMDHCTRWVVEGDPDWSAESTNNTSRADGVRTILHNRLMTLLTLPDSDITRESKMAYLTTALDTHCATYSAWNGFLKPDFTGFHHLGIWGNAYITEALTVASQMAMILHNTPYAMSSVSTENLAQGLIAYSDYSAQYDINRGLCGRFPSQLNNLHANTPAFAFIYETLSGELKETIGRRFGMLYRPDLSLHQTKMIKDVTSSIAFNGSMGVIEKCNSLKQSYPEQTVSLSLNRVFPYGALQVHRRDDWSVSFKGYNKYVWDFESNAGENFFGRNQSLGQLALYSGKDAEGIVTAEASGVGYNGYDWAHIPGVTSFNMTMAEIYTEARYFDWAKFSSEFFAGGVTNGLNGVYGMRFMDIRQAYDYVPKRVWVGPRLTANKSVFFFNDLVLSLASDVKNTHSSFDAHTTLFQNLLPSASTPTSINGTAYTALGQNYEQSQSASLYMTDVVGNGYYLRDGKGLKVIRSTQTSRDDKNKADTQGEYATAYLDHGKSIGAAYEYAILVSGADRIQALAADPSTRYVVERQDAVAHIVCHLPTSERGYAVFDPSQALNDKLVAAVSEPCLLMSREVDPTHIDLSVSNPELGFYPKDKFPFQVWSVDADKTFAPSQLQPVIVSLKGQWEPTETSTSIEWVDYDATTDVTRLRVNVLDAQSYTSRLELKNPSSIDGLSDNSFRYFFHSEQRRLVVSALPVGIETIDIQDLLGAVRLQIAVPAGSDTVESTLSNLPSGVYLLKVGDVVRKIRI